MNFDYCNGSVYVIKQGDTLYSISRRYSVPLALILRANPYVDIYNLQIGDELCIPGDQPSYPEVSPEPGPLPLPTPELPFYPEVSPGPGPLPLPTPELPSYPEVSPGPGPLPLPTPELPSYPCNQTMCHVIAYVVKDKDTLQKLLDYFGITLADLLKHNNLSTIMLRPGMTIQIPKKSDD